MSQIAYTQTKLLLDSKIYEVLLELSSIDDVKISLRAQRLLRKLTVVMYNFIPYNQVKKPDFLMNSISFEDSKFDFIKSKCSTIFENISTKLTKKNTLKQFRNEFLFKCEYFYLNMTSAFPDHRLNKEIVEKIKFQDEGTLDEVRLQSLIKSSAVLTQKEWTKWNFQDISLIIDNIDSDVHMKQFADLCEKDFFKKLIRIYQPSQHAFIDLPWKPENFIYAKVGHSLIKLLLKSQYGRNLLSDKTT